MFNYRLLSIDLQNGDSMLYYGVNMDNNPFSEGTSSFGEPKKKSSKKRLFILILGIIVLIMVIFGGINFLGAKNQKSSETKQGPTPTEFQIPTDTPTPKASASPAVKVSPTSVAKTPTPKQTIGTVDKATGLDRAKITVEVQNGSGEVGVAGKMATYLRDLGYKIGATGNADNYEYRNVVVKAKSADSKYLSLIKKDLSASYTVGDASLDLSASSSADILVIVGK